MMKNAFELNTSKKKNLKQLLLKEFALVQQDTDFVKLINSLDVEEDKLMNNTTKLKDTISQLHNCKNCKGLHTCTNKVEGHVTYPKVVDGSLQFSYMPCKYMKAEELETKKVVYYETPVSLKNAKMKDIFIDDKARVKVIKYLNEYIKTFGTDKQKKGLYLHGSFGCGKSFMVSAVINELGKNGVEGVNVYYPNLLKTLKDSFNDDFKEKYDAIINSRVLLIDDIGAENNTPWARDEILGTILQYRMDNNLSTFFTSNFTIDELEQHLSQTSNSVDKIKARRIIERIKQLTVDMELIGENRR